jgi:Fibronectin type III domain
MYKGIKTWNTLELFTSSDHNDYTNGDMNYLYGDALWSPIPQYDNGWTISSLDVKELTYAWPSYRKSGNWVRLRGVIENGIGQQGLPAFTLPLGAIPLDSPSNIGYLEWVCWSDCPGGFAMVRIACVEMLGFPPGTVWPNFRNAGLPGSQYNFSLDGVVFNAGAGAVVVTPGSGGPPPVPTPTSVPGSPTNVVGVAGNGDAVVSWFTPLDNGGSAITGYTVTASPGGITVTTAAAANTAFIPGLINGLAYTFQVVATNAVGSSTPSNVSAPVIPLVSISVPGAPTAVVAVAGVNSATVTWVAPADGGSLITQYTVLSTPDGQVASTVGLTTTVYGLAHGTAYTFTVRAVNALGTGPASAASAAVTP